MVLFKTFWLPVAAVLTALSSSAFADTVRCKIEIEDMAAEVQSKSAAKQVVDFNFELTPGTGAQRKHFDLPGGQYFCTLAFFDLDSGTSLSCGKKKDSGHTYVQSDRSDIRERSARNNLVFRDGTSHFVLDATCK